MTSKLTREKAQWLHDACEEAAAAGIKLTMNPNELLMFTSYALAAMDSEPVAEVLSSRPGNDTSTIDRALPVGTRLYHHAQQPVVPAEWTIADAVKFCLETGRQDAGAAMDAWNACRAAMLQADNCRENSNSSTNNCREIAETSTNRSREHFISLCNEFWNWSEMDLVCADDRSYELRMEWDGKVFNHPVTQALWRMYQAAHTGIPMISDRWTPVSERMPERGDYLVTDGSDFDVQMFNGEWFTPGFVWEDKITHWMPLPAAPQEVKP